MQKGILIVSVLTITLFSLVVFCSAADTTDINSLIENAKALNNTEISINGEVIGEPLERDEYAWINVNDGTNAIGVWVKQSDIADIKYYGDYKHKGDIISITGVFHNSCTEHGGDFDIHSQSIKIEHQGQETVEKISSHKLITALILIVIAFLLLFKYYRFVKRIKCEK